MGIAPLAFTGVSSFSADFQTILDRARQISQVSVKQLQNKDSDVLQRKTLLGGLSSSVSALASSLRALGTTASNRALSANSSDTSKVTVTNSGATLATSYTINSITSTASAASERTTASYADSAATPVSSNGSLKLVVGGQEFAFSLTANTLIGLRDKINTLGAGVTASILTTGAGNYLSVTANGTGNKPVQLFDDPGGANVNLITAANPGTNAVFSLNGIPISQTGNVVNTLIPGLTFSLQAASATPVTLTLATDRSQLGNAVADFVAKFNSVREQVNGQIGPSAGLLSGSTVISQLSDRLRQVGSYRTSSGAVRSLTDLGVEFDANGVAKLNADTFNALSDSAITDGFSFLGSATTGLGGFSEGFRQIGDPVGGLIQVEQSGLDRTDQRLQTQIANLNERITIQQNSLAAKLHAADALLARLASQQTQLGASLQGLNLTIYGKNQG